MQYITHDVLQIYIFESYVQLWIKEIARRSLHYDGPGFMAQTPRASWQKRAPQSSHSCSTAVNAFV